MAYNVAASTIIPLRVQIRIEGNNTPTINKVKKAIDEHFKNSNNKTSTISFSKKGDVRQTGEVLLVQRKINAFETDLSKFISEHGRDIEDELHGDSAHYSFFDGGLNFALKKKVYVITVKDSEKVATQQEIQLMGANSIQSSLEELLKDKFAEGGDVDKSQDNTVFRFKLRGDSNREELKKEIKELCKKMDLPVTIDSDNPLVVDARAGQTEFVVLDVSKLKFTQIQKVEKYLDKRRFNGKSTMTIPGSQTKIGEMIGNILSDRANVDISGDWENKDGKSIFIFKPVRVQILRIKIDKTPKWLCEDFSKLQKEYGIEKKRNKLYAEVPCNARWRKNADRF